MLRGYMRILLTSGKWAVHPDGWNPIGMLDLAVYWRGMGFEVDCHYLDGIPQREYDIVGLSVFSGSDLNKIDNALMLKKRFPKAKIIVGGRWTQYIEMQDRAVLDSHGIEVWVGNGEDYFGNGVTVDFASYPSWSAWDFATLQDKGTYIMSSRGCPYSCNFCHNIERSLSFFSPSRTADNIELLFSLGIPEVFFVDDIFTLKTRHMIGVLEECQKRGIPLEGRNRFFTHINCVNEESVKVMERFNPLEVQVGLESGDSGMLRLMGKTFTPQKAYDKLKLLSRHVPVNGLFLIGYPGETVESLTTTLAFVREVRSFLSQKWVSYYQPVPSTVGHTMTHSHGTTFSNVQDNSRPNYIDNNLTPDDLIHFHREISNA